LGALAVALVTMAGFYALRPFDLSVDLSNKSITLHGKALIVQGRCDAAARTAWNRDPKDGLELWAVTVGTKMMGYTPVFGSNVKYQLLGSPIGQLPDSFCAGEARHRLIVSGGIVASAVVAALVATILIRRRRSSAHAVVDI